MVSNYKNKKLEGIVAQPDSAVRLPWKSASIIACNSAHMYFLTLVVSLLPYDA